jgi:hypothetical protein
MEKMMKNLKLIAAICDEVNIMKDCGAVRDDCDIAQLIDIAEARLKQEGWHQNSINRAWKWEKD